MAITNLYTLIDLFKTTEEQENGSLPLNKIEIPIIQRDYAQGRNVPEVNRIRKRFLGSLHTALTENKQLKLDFVYGDINEEKVLTPLDGQQRLTTLFLLHWYIGRHEGIEDSKIEFLKKFSYKTRYSARTFCQYLVEYTPNFTLTTLSEDITDQSWMPLDWKNDPTISAILNMLDDIHSMFKDTDGLWSLLEEGCIAFYFLSIKDMGLTDELYIKMNSRGKPLTEFEHFKAEWEGYMKTVDEAMAEQISKKIDIAWTDILWPYKGDNNIIDDEFVRYYKYLCAIIFYKKYPTESIPDDIFDLTRDLFLEKKEDAKENLAFIEKSFDCLEGVNIKECFDRFLTNEPHVDGKSHIDESIDVFEHCCNSYGEHKNTRVRSFSIGRMLLLYCFILYWKNKETISETQFAKRLRIINNMIKASEFELREDRMNTLLLQTEEVIIEGNVLMPEGRNTFNSMQVQEEMDKKQWLAEHPETEQQLYILEDHPLLNGGVSVVGLNNLDYTDRFFSLFDCNKGLVNQALLTIGDYSLKVGWRYQVGSARIDATWKTLFHTNKDNVRKIHDILIALLDKAESFTDDILKGIIDEYLSKTIEFDWRYYLVKYDSMRPEKYGMYYWYDYQTREKESYDILMMLTEKSIGGRNFNIFLKTLYDKFKSEYPDKSARLGEYAYQEDGDCIELNCIGKIAYYQDNEFVIEDAENPEDKQSVTIDQNDKIDAIDRIEVGWNEICKLMS